MRWTTTLGAAGLVVAAAGCTSSDGTTASMDCAPQVRIEGTVFTSTGYTDHRAHRLGTAELAACHDTGEDPPGSVFGDRPDHVATFAFPGYATDEVISVRFDHERFTVFVSDSVDAPRQRAIVRGLSRRS